MLVFSDSSLTPQNNKPMTYQLTFLVAIYFNIH